MTGYRSVPIAVAFLCPVLWTAGSGCRSTTVTPVIGYLREPAMESVVRLTIRQLEDSLAGQIRFVSTAVEASDSSPTASDVRAAVRLVETPGISGVVGAGSSRGAAASAPVFEEAQVPVVVPTATSRVMRQLGAWTFALAPNDSAEALFLARQLRQRFRAHRVVLFYVDDEYGTGLRDGLRGALAADSIELTAARPLSQQPGWCLDTGPSATFRAVVRSALHQGRPDAVIAAVRDRSAGCLVSVLRAEGLDVPLVLGDGALLLPQMWRVAGGTRRDSVFAVAFWHPDLAGERSQRFVREFVRRNGRPPNAGEAMRYDAIRILVAASLEVGPDRGAIRQWLLARGRSAPAYEGVTGPIVFGPGRAPTFYLVRAGRGGAAELVAP